MRKLNVLLITGVVLIIVAFLTASPIPKQANNDLQRLFSKGKLYWATKEGEYLYVQGNEHRRLLQNFYLGASGLICLCIGLLTLPNKNSNDAPSQSASLKNENKSGENK
jgi:hypothetical protein